MAGEAAPLSNLDISASAQSSSEPFRELLEASDALLDIVLKLHPQMTYEDPPGLVRACERVAVIIGQAKMTSRRSSRRPEARPTPQHRLGSDRK